MCPTAVLLLGFITRLCIYALRFFKVSREPVQHAILIREQALSEAEFGRDKFPEYE